MKAIVCMKYGPPDVLQFKEVAKPSPKDNEVLIRIHAASVNQADLHFLRGKPFPIRLIGFALLQPKHKILGADIAGRVEAVGSAVRQFKPGDEVFGDIFASGFGGFAEYVCAREDALTLKPAGLTFEQAAAVPMAALTALQGLRDKGQIQSRQNVLINGASGGVGTFAVQIAKSFGAEVTGVCSTGKSDMVRSIGADHVIDYTQEDFAKNGQEYDLILAANGNRSVSEYKRALSRKGRCVVTGGSDAQVFQAMLLGGKRVRTIISRPNQNDMVFIKGLLEAEKVKPIIDRCYTLDQVADAFRYLEEGHARGKIIINLEPQ